MSSPVSFRVIFKLFAISTLIEFSHSMDYCNKELCRRMSVLPVKHIGCKNNGDFGPQCPKIRSVEPMTPHRISLLLHTHNQLRSDIANGKLRRYEPANKMIEMQWDYELARLAEMKAKTCVFAHDECRSTAQHLLAGQNLQITWDREYDDVDFRLIESTHLWFNEHEQCDMSYIINYRAPPPDKNIGHFIQIVKDSADRVGCSLSKYDDGKLKNMLLVCNYAVGDVVGEPVYTTGSPCSGCLSGCSSFYKGLCNSNEKSYWG